MRTLDSPVPGDTLYVGTDAWGVANHRTFTISSIYYGDNRKFDTVETPAASGPVAGPTASVQLRSYMDHPIGQGHRLHRSHVCGPHAELREVHRQGSHERRQR